MLGDRHMNTRRLAVLTLITLLSGCIGNSEVSSPPANDAIHTTTGTLTALPTVECDGPSDEVALLGELCGMEVWPTGWLPTHRGGFAADIGPDGGPFILIFADPVDSSGSLASRLRYSVYIQQNVTSLGYAQGWRSAEPVTDGAVTTDHAEHVGCSGDTWTGQGEVLWRNTTVRFSWSGALGC